jgi:lipopolysaccharide export system permease protein
MRLLDRYLLRELLVPLSYCLGGFLILWVAFDLFGELSDFQKLRLRPGDVLEFYLVKMPEFLINVVPIAFLLALLYALTNHARHHELTAIRAAGVSMLRLSMPYVLVGFLLSIGLFALNELWVPKSTEAAELILSRRQPNRQKESQSLWHRRFGFKGPDATRNWFIESFNLATSEMIRVYVDTSLPDGSRREIFAERGGWTEQGWMFTNVIFLLYPADKGALPMREEREVLPAPEFTETPEFIRSEIRYSKLEGIKAVRKAQLSVREILEYRRLHPRGSARDSVLDTKLHGRLSAPWTCLVVVVIALPFGAATGRRNVIVGVASSIVICFAYFVLQQLGLALGSGGFLPGWVAAWLPNAFFAVGGLYLTWRTR